MTDTINERLNRVLRNLERMLGEPEKDERRDSESNLNRLIRFGFTPDEAKGFLEQEPDYRPSTDFTRGDEPTDKYIVPDDY
ncbi:MAG: hypothetical protein V1850_00350 [Candidatus Bathyarchaeota archaeon]